MLTDKLCNKWSGVNFGAIVTVGFDGAITCDLILAVTGYDIDFAIELNGTRIGLVAEGRTRP